MPLLSKPRTPMIPNADLISYARDIPFMQSVFRNKLLQIMELQIQILPDLTIPLILHTMVNLIISTGGLTTTGIFRVAAKMSDVSTLRFRLESSQGAPLEKDGFLESLDPHIPACVLKLWLTEILEPLVPSEYYMEVTQHSKDWETLNRIISEFFPPANRNCLYYLINFLQIVMKEDNKMNAYNLAIVISPTLCRAPIFINIENLMNQKSIETEFCCTLLNNMPCMNPIFSTN